MNTRRVLPAARIVLAVALLISAAVMWRNLPGKLDSWAPIVTDGRPGERVVGRNLAVTVHEVKLARTVTFAADGVPTRLPAGGVWVAIGLTYESLLTTESPAFELQALGNTYEAPLSGIGSDVPPGLPTRGVLAFELPDIPAAATLLVQNKVTNKYGNPLDAPLDSQLRIPVPVPSTPDETVDLDELGAP